MTHFPFDIVGFDLDGTLLDTSGDLAAAVNHALASAGRAPLPVEQIKPMIGGGARLMLQQALARPAAATSEFDGCCRGCSPITRRISPSRPGPFPAARGARCAGRTRRRAGGGHQQAGAFRRPAARELGLTDRFACVIGGDTIAGKAKPDPAPIDEMLRRCGGGRAAFVGDSLYDVDAARAAGVPVAVYGDAADGDAAFGDYRELLSTLERLAAQ